MTPAELQRLGAKLRTHVRGEFFEYIEGTLPLIGAPVKVPKVDGCPACAKRRAEKAEAQKRWRRNAKGKAK